MNLAPMCAHGNNGTVKNTLSKWHLCPKQTPGSFSCCAQSILYSLSACRSETSCLCRWLFPGSDDQSCRSLTNGCCSQPSTGLFRGSGLLSKAATLSLLQSQPTERRRFKGQRYNTKRFVISCPLN